MNILGGGRWRRVRGRNYKGAQENLWGGVDRYAHSLDYSYDCIGRHMYFNSYDY